MKQLSSHGQLTWLPALTCVAALGAANVQAQSPPASSSSVDKLEEVLVTAERRTESLQTTAISASVLTGDMLEDKGVSNLFALQYAAPSVTIAGYGSANVFNIRGIGRSQVDIDVPSGVVIYRDGAPTLAGYFQNEPYFDLSSIEVLRGPQGTFVGKTAAGGAIFIRTNDAELGKLDGNVEAGAGNDSEKEITGVINIPVADTFALRLAYKHTDSDNYYHSITGNFTGHPGERDLNSYRLSLHWQPTEQLTLLAKVDYHDLDFGGNVTSSFGDPLFDVEQNANFAYKDESVRGVLNIKYQAGGYTFSSLSAVQDLDTVNNLDLNATQDPFYVFNSKANVKIYSQELNIVSPDDRRVRWVTGAFWEKQTADIPTWEKHGFTFVGGGFPTDFPWLTSPWQKNEDEWAVFGQVSTNLNERVELKVGARYSHYETDQFTEWLFGNGLVPPNPGQAGVIPFPGTTAGGDRQAISEHSVDGSVSLNWTASDRHFLYGVISRGHVTGGINLFPPFGVYDEMEVLNYEAGWKSNWLEDRFRTQLSVYYETFDKYQANFGREGGIILPTNRNADGKSHVAGVELSGQALMNRWSLDFGIAYLDSKLGTFRNVDDPFSGQTVDLTGAHSPFSPEWTGNVGVAYELPIFAGMTLTPRLDYSYISETRGALWDSPLVKLQSRGLLNALVNVDSASGKWRTSLWMTNATDKEYVAGIQNNGTLRYAGAPRQYGLRIRYNF
jgi:iron complex outermembrane receptor protein